MARSRTTNQLTLEAPSDIPTRTLQEEVEGAFLEYAMSVIVQRALPDVRDGLKPVQRRLLWAMHDATLRPERPFANGQHRTMLLLHRGTFALVIQRFGHTEPALQGSRVLGAKHAFHDGPHRAIFLLRLDVLALAIQCQGYVGPTVKGFRVLRAEHALPHGEH